MDRNVYRRAVRAPDGYQTDQEPGAAEKLVKYFPVEALALYCVLEPTVMATSGVAWEGLLWAALGLVVVFCAVYLHLTWQVTRLSHLLISCIALVLYVAALGGPFATLPVFAPGYAVAAAVAATALMLLVPSPLAPRSSEPEPTGQPRSAHRPRPTADSDRRR